MENVFATNTQAIGLYKASHEVTDWFQHLKKELKKVVRELKDLGFGCAVCGREVDEESFKRDDYSPLSRCAKCMKNRA